MDLAITHPHPSASGLPLEQLARNPALSERDKVAELSRQFEAVLLRQILREASQPVFAGPLGSSSATRSIYQDMVNDRMADAISQSGALGLGRGLEHQLQQQVLPHSSAGAGVQPVSPGKS